MIHFHHHPTCMLLVKLCIFFVQNKFVAVFVKLMSLLQTSEGALDPSYFLSVLSKLSPRLEILLLIYLPSRMLLNFCHVLEELCGESLNASVDLLEFISERLYLSRHASSILQLKTNLLFSSCLFQGRSRCP